MIAAKNTAGLPFYQMFFKMFLVIIVSGAFLIGGYMLCFRAFKNIWVVSAISITSILIVEPLTTYLIFHELPARGPIVGLVLGVLGFVAALFL